MLYFLRYFVSSMNQAFSLNVIRYDNSYKSEWNYFVKDAKNGTFLFHRNFMEYHEAKFIDYSLMFFSNEELVAILPANIVNDTVYSHQGLTYGGLIVKNKCKFTLYKELFFCLMRYFKKEQIRFFKIKPLPSLYGDASNDELIFLQQFYSCTVEHNMGSVIYEKPEISKSIYRNARNAVKNGVEIRKSDDFEFFWNHLLIPRLQNRFEKKPIHSLNEIIYLKILFPDEIQLYGAFLENEMVAGTVLFQNKNFTKSQYIASNPKFNKMGGLDLLHLELIKNVQKRFFDFGTSSADQSFHENESLLSWKEQFGARTLVLSTYTFNLTL